MDPRGLAFMLCVSLGQHEPEVDAATGETLCERCGAQLPPVDVQVLDEPAEAA